MTKPNRTACRPTEADIAAFWQQIDKLRAQGDTMGNAFDRGEAARLAGKPASANPWYDAEGELIHIAALDWHAGWRDQDDRLAVQPDLFALVSA